MKMYLRLLRITLQSRRAPRISLWDTVVTRFRVHPFDLDVLRHMNNGTYLTLADLGRVDLMMRSGFSDEAKRRGWYPVVAAQTITYRRSLRLGQRFELHTRILGFDGDSVLVEQSYLSGEKRYARAVIRARFLQRSGGAVPADELIGAVGDLPATLEIPEWVRSWASDSRLRDA